MAIRRAGFWECLPGGGTCEITPTPISFTCPTPQAVQAYNGTTAVTTCFTPGGGGGTCPAGVNTEVQYNDSNSCGADTNFTWAKGTHVLSIIQPTPASTPTPGYVLFNIQNSQNTAQSGAWQIIANAGTAASADEGISFDSGVAGANRYINMGRVSDTGNRFEILANSSFVPDIRTGTGYFIIDPANDQVLIKEMGSSTVPGFAWINDAATGVSFTSTGGLQRTIYHILNNVPSFFEEHVVTGSNVVAINQRFRLIADAPAALSGAGPATLVPVNALEEVSTSNAGGTAVQLDITNIQEGSIVTVMNTSANDLTFQTASSGAICQKTAGGAMQTLAGDGSSIQFMAHSSCWVQTRAVVDPS